MERCEYRRKYGSVKKQALKQGVVSPIRAIISKRTGVHEVASATVPSEDSRSTYHLPSDSGVSEAGSSHNEPISTPVSSSKSLMLEENLSTAPALTINPRLIAAIPEEPLLEKLKDEDLQNAVVYQNSKLFEKIEGEVRTGQWVTELLF